MCSVVGRRRHARRAASGVLFTHAIEVYEERAQHGDDVRQCFRIAYPRSDDCLSWYPEPSIRSGTRPARRLFRVWHAQKFAAQRLHNEATSPHLPDTERRPYPFLPIWGRPHPGRLRTSINGSREGMPRTIPRSHWMQRCAILYNPQSQPHSTSQLAMTLTRID